MKTRLQFSMLLYPAVFIAAGLTSVLLANTTAAAEPATFTLMVKNVALEVDKKTILTWQGTSSLASTPQFIQASPETKTTTYHAHAGNIYTWVMRATKPFIQEVQEPKLQIENGMTVEFVPPLTGTYIDAVQTTRNILTALEHNQTIALASVYTATPSGLLSSMNTLGIEELVGHGESIFKGSPKNRRHNIKVGVEKLQGLILNPGQEFSFNENICPVDRSAGYLPELVIKAEGTIPEYGGGLCQVSSTVFRAAMNAGLEIVQRKNHSYAVQYYSPQGTDATTYCGGIDFKFKNDMSTSVLIWPYFEAGDKLVFDFYGTKDSRVVELEKPVQYDRKSDGSMKATWVRHVTKNGETHTDTFRSVYLPPALFHKEEDLDALNQSTQPPSTGSTATPSSSPPTNGTVPLSNTPLVHPPSTIPIP